jgi:hypothetical protein
LVEGAIIDECFFTMDAADEDCVTLMDSASSITNSTLLVTESGTGVPINASSAQSVCAVGNRYNNSDNDTNGLGANVTNLGVVADGGDASSANQTTIINHLVAIKGTTFDESTDSVEAIRNRGDAAWITGAGGGTTVNITTETTTVESD